MLRKRPAQCIEKDPDDHSKDRTSNMSGFAASSSSSARSSNVPLRQLLKDDAKGLPTSQARFSFLRTVSSCSDPINLLDESNAKGEGPGNQVCTADDLAKWLQDHDGTLPQRKSKAELDSGDMACQREHRLYLYVRRQKEALASSKFHEKGSGDSGVLSTLQVKKRSETWEKNCDALKSWLTTGEGDKIVYPRRQAENEVERKLAMWIHEQRTQHRDGVLGEAREKALYDLPSWRWSDFNPPWFETYKRLKTWLESGDSLDTTEKIDKLVNSDLRKLRGEHHAFAKWVQQQRDAYARKNRRNLSAMQVSMLEDLDEDHGFPWPDGALKTWDDYHETLVWWGERFDGLPVSSDPDEQPRFDVDHPVHGWMGIGHFFKWSQIAIQQDKDGEPVESRWKHRFHPSQLSERQTQLIENWAAGREGSPRRKKIAKPKRPKQTTQTSPTE